MRAHAGRRVIATNDMVAKIRVAIDSRSSPDFLVIARTDARSALGLDEALRRGEAYARAGAIFCSLNRLNRLTR